MNPSSSSIIIVRAKNTRNQILQSQGRRRKSTREQRWWLHCNFAFHLAALLLQLLLLLVFVHEGILVTTIIMITRQQPLRFVATAALRLPQETLRYSNNKNKNNNNIICNVVDERRTAIGIFPEPYRRRFNNQLCYGSTKNNNVLRMKSSSSSSMHNDESSIHIMAESSLNNNNNNNNTNNDYEQYYQCFFDQQVPEGRCVGIQLIPVSNDHLNSFVQDDLLFQSLSSSSSLVSSPTSSWSFDNDNTGKNRKDDHQQHWICNYLHPDEILYGLKLHHINHRQSFYMGRLAIRHALQQQQQQSRTTTTSTTTTSTNKSSWVETNNNNNNNTNTHDNNNEIPQHKTMMIQKGNNNTSSIRNSILKDMYGRPQLPYGYFGSISHKGLMGVALVQQQQQQQQLQHNGIIHPSSSIVPTTTTTTTPQMGIGVDIEDISNAYRRRNVARKVLTLNEIQNLGTLSYSYNHKNCSDTATILNHDHASSSSSYNYLSIEEEILLRFSCKESVYKAIHPLINQYVSFQEAEIQPYINGTATVTLNLVSSDRMQRSRTQQHFMTPIILHWYRYENYIITTASIRLLE